VKKEFISQDLKVGSVFQDNRKEIPLDKLTAN